MVGESAVEAFQVMQTASHNYSRDDVSWSGPFDCLQFASGRPIGSVKPFSDPGHTEPFLHLSVSGNNFVLLSEIVVSFFGNVFLQSFELLLPLAEGPFFSS